LTADRYHYKLLLWFAIIDLVGNIRELISVFMWVLYHNQKNCLYDSFIKNDVPFQWIKYYHIIGYHKINYRFILIGLISEGYWH